MNDWTEAERRAERAQVLFRQRRWEQAVDELRAATSINPYNASWFFQIGLAFDELGRPADAVRDYRLALELDPNDPATLWHLGTDLHRLGDFPAALGAFERMEKVDRSNESSYCPRVLIYADLGEHDKAEEMFYVARLYREQCPACYANLGASLATRGLTDKAIACFRKAIDLDPADPTAHARLAGVLWRAGDLEQARRQYLVALRYHPGDTNLILDLARLLSDMGRTDEAGEKYRRAVETSPDSATTNFGLGRWSAQVGKYDDAVDLLGRAIELDPTLTGAHVELARVHLSRQDVRAAMYNAHAEVRLRPTGRRQLLDLSNLLIDLGDVSAGAACLERFTVLHPEDARGWQNLAVALFLARRFEDGFEAGRRAIELRPTEPAALFNLSLACERQKQWDRALDYAERGRRADPGNAALARLEKRLRVLRWMHRLRDAVTAKFVR